MKIFGKEQNNYKSEAEYLTSVLVNKLVDEELDALTIFNICKELYNLGYSAGWEIGDKYTKEDMHG